MYHYDFSMRFVIILLNLQCVSSTIYPWIISKIDYPSQSRYLDITPLEKIGNRPVVSQCAMDCIQTDKCVGFNFLQDPGLCELHDLIYSDVDSTALKTNNSSGYYLKQTFAIEEEALGACTKVKCHNGGVCLEKISTANSPDAFVCVCSQGWTGKECETKDTVPEWSAWGAWGKCSVSCGSGWKLRTRICQDSVQQSVHPLQCGGRDTDIQPCDLERCPRWEDWSAWTSCSTDMTCGKGHRSRSRLCSNGGKIGVDRYCMGPANETGICYSIGCSSPIRLRGGALFGEGRIELYNDVTQKWGSVCSDNWNSASARTACRQIGLPELAEVVTDGRYGVENEIFTVSNFTCTGTATHAKIQKCQHSVWSENTKCLTGISAGVKCKVNGDWNMWSKWGECSVTCGDGTQTRTRLCNLPPPLHGGKQCIGESTELRPCVRSPCPGSGQWGTWGPWEACDVSCEAGRQRRYRTCVDTLVSCTGVSEESQSCNTNIPCPVDGEWLHWSTWSACDMSCAGGQRLRQRDCSGPKHGGKGCTGDASDSETCNSQECPIDGYWLQWSDWTSCSKSCESGTRERVRECVAGKYSGKDCSGTSMETGNCNSQPCPVDGLFGEWSPWGECLNTCGGGMETRIRLCSPPLHGGKDCVGEAEENQMCNKEPCPVDGEWAEWSSWSSCPVSCGGAARTRKRACRGQAHGGRDCEGTDSEEEPCNTSPCPVDGEWGSWSDWGTCSRTCNGGTRKRERVCTGQAHGGKDCEGTDWEVENCNTIPCPVDGEFTSWSEWGQCSVTCGGGTQTRNRDCILPQHGGEPCNGERFQIGDCNTDECPVDGEWTAWSDWGACSVSCNGGTRERERTCIGQAHGGEDCEGNDWEVEDCNTIPCPVDGQWAEWSDWGTCSLSCNGGTRERERVCTGQAHGGKDCEGTAREVEKCNTTPCPVDGEFAAWSTWGLCSVSCGGGTRTRNRDCILPQHGGKPCDGDRFEIGNCGTEECPVDGVWAAWSDWGACFVSCDGGTRKRERVCTGQAHGGEDCEGNDWEVEDCNTIPCPVDGEFTTWSSWGTCSVTCGGGTRTRNRDCILPQHGGKPCDGDRYQIGDCGTDDCPVPGRWNVWGDWSECSVSCGGGQRKRERTCDGPYFGGEPCAGEASEHEKCTQTPCPRIWKTWSDWTLCSVTCGGGTRTRSRQCDMESFGDLTSPCDGDSEEAENCHQFPCEPYARTCSGLKSLGMDESRKAEIDPDGPGGEKQIRVFCNLVDENGVGVTVIGHNHEEEEEVNGYEGAGEYDTGLLVYNASWDQVLSLIDYSDHCEQYISWKCRGTLIHNYKSKLLDGDGFTLTTYWRTRSGTIADYWGGSTPGSNACACGITGTCANKTLPCNCDSNDDVWREDAGFITFKDDLPITSFAAGDTGFEGTGIHLIGPIMCWDLPTDSEGEIQ